MAKIEIIRLNDVESQPIPGRTDLKEGVIKRIVYPPRINTKRTMFAYAEVKPGYSPHRWHTHEGDEAKGYKVEYDKDFEEIYYIIRGSGVMQWKTKDGKIEEKKVTSGDTIFMPVGVLEHQLLNNGNEELIMVACGSPVPNVTFTK